MKKIFNIIIVLILIVGCKDNNINNEKELKEELTDKLKEYSYNIFDETWTKGGIKEDTYTITLRDLKEKLNYDISMFKNSKDKDCNYDETKIEFIVKTQIIPNVTNYETKYYIVCD